jgi:hypothetical protein
MRSNLICKECLEARVIRLLEQKHAIHLGITHIPVHIIQIKENISATRSNLKQFKLNLCYIIYEYEF